MIVYRELSSLERDLGIRASTLYAVSNTVERHYHTVSLPKRDGGCRLLSVPDPQLKRIQRRIAQVLLAPMPVSPYAMAYRYGASVVRNAALHAGRPAVLKLDIRHFFDSILYASVKEAAFPAEIYGEPLRILLTILCYHRDGLPQGAPSSPAISNLVLRTFDDETAAWCRDRKIRYTRYCDDLTFSGSFEPEAVIAFVREQLRKRGFFSMRKNGVCSGGAAAGCDGDRGQRNAQCSCGVPAPAAPGAAFLPEIRRVGPYGAAGNSGFGGTLSASSAGTRQLRAANYA